MDKLERRRIDRVLENGTGLHDPGLKVYSKRTDREKCPQRKKNIQTTLAYEDLLIS